MIAISMLVAGISQGRADTVTWTNTLGGAWSDAANWSPNQVPASGDEVLITNTGTYTVTNNSAVTLSNLTVGGTNGTQTLMISSLTLANLGLVNSNGVLNWNGGNLEGVLTVSAGGTLVQSNILHFSYNNYAYGYTNISYLTNYGTVIWAGTIDASANSSTHGGGGLIYNGGLWDAVADQAMGIHSGNGTNNFINAGTLEKTAATGTSTIGWDFSSDGGTVNTPGGAFSMGNWVGNGTVHGVANFTGGTITGTLASDCAVNSSATITGALFISSNAVARWSGGDVEGSLTVEAGGTLIQSNTLHFAYNNYAYGYTNTACLTNDGTVLWAGTIDAAANATTHGGGGVIFNAGLWNAVADLAMGFYSGAGTNYFINAGTLEKTAAAGTSTIGWNFSSSGVIDTFSGTFNLNWGGPSTLNGNLFLTGTIATPLMIASNAVLQISNGDLESALTVAQGGTLIQSNNLHFAYDNYALGYTNTALLTNYGTVIWAGTIDAAANATTHGGGGVIYNAGLWNVTADSSMSVYSGAGTNYFINVGTLEKTAAAGASTIGWNFYSAGGTLQTLSGFFTFDGTWNPDSLTFGTATVSQNLSGTIASNALITWLGGDIESPLTVAQGGTLVQSNTLHFAYNNYALGYTNTAYLTNYGTVVWAGTIDAAANSTTHGGGGVIYNAGIWNAVTDLSIAVFSGAGTNYFINSGTLEKTTGIGASTIGWTVENSGTLGSQTNTLSLTGNYDLTGGTLNSGINGPGNNGIIHLSSSPAALTGTLRANLNNGYVPATGSAFDVLTYNSENGVFTNFLPPFAVAMQTNYGATKLTLTVLNVRPVLNTIADQDLNELTTLGVTATAADMDAGQSLAFGLVSGPDGLTVSLSGAIAWTPDETQGPSTNLVFVKVSDNGTPPLSATNSFTITVNEVNIAPALDALSNWKVNPGQAVSFMATATDADIPTNTLTFGLVSPPAGASMDSGGLFSWRPTVAQANTTNVVQVRVTDYNPWTLNSQHLSNTNSFTVIVNPLAPVVLTPASYANGQLSFQVSGTVGPDYVIAASTNLSVWSDIFTNFSPATPFLYTNTATYPIRFYRVRPAP